MPKKNKRYEVRVDLTFYAQLDLPETIISHKFHQKLHKEILKQYKNYQYTEAKIGQIKELGDYSFQELSKKDYPEIIVEG